MSRVLVYDEEKVNICLRLLGVDDSKAKDVAKSFNQHRFIGRCLPFIPFRAL